jgi:magnesium transporter
VKSYLLDRHGVAKEGVDRTSIEAHLASGEFFWLDLHEPDESDFAVLREVFGFHPLAVEDSEQFGQRPKIDDYGGYSLVVLYGAAPDPDEDNLVEVHCFYSERFLVTVRRDEAPGCDAVRERFLRRPAPIARPIVVLYRLVDALVDSFYPALDSVDSELEDLEDAVLVAQADARLQDVLALRRRLVRLRHALVPQRDLVGQLAGGIVELPGLDDEAARYFRDIHDHLTGIAEQVDVERELLTGALDVYLSGSSNRLNMTMKQLTIIATIFLPLTFLTGFFGQNFGWMVDQIGALGAFLALGLGLQLVALMLLLGVFRRFRWF